MKQHHHKHKNILFLIIGFIIAIIVSTNPSVTTLLSHLGNLKYLGAFLAGALFTSTFTVATGIVILLALAKSLSLPLLVLLASMGAAIGDFLIFKFVKDDIEPEITPIYNELLGKSHFKKILHTKYFSWTLPVIGALIIISPLPDELGISLMDMSKIALSRFMLISWLSHSVGISFIVGASRIL